MKYYILQNSKDRKQVGFPYQTSGYIDGYDIDGPNSRTKLTYDKFPEFIPDLRFELHPKSKLTDVVEASNISAIGFLIDEKVKNIFAQYELPSHKYFEASIKDHNGNVLPYYWMHIISNDYGIIDFKNSTFRKSIFPLKDSETKKEEEIEIDGIDELREKKDKLFNESLYIVADILKIHSDIQYDMLHFGDVDVSSVFISEKLANMLKKAKVTGIDITEYPDLQNLE